MHQPDTRARRSIYHHYQVYAAAPRPADGGASGTAAPVVVVGAGPIGMVLALDLARRGVRVLLLTAEQQVSEGSRAIVFTRRSMEILQQVGADHAITARGLPWRFGNSHYRGRRVYRMEAPFDANDRFHPMINLQQQVLEEALVALIAAQPLVELRWGHKVIGVQEDPAAAGSAGGATLEVDTPEGPYTQRANWVVACDGARSSLREMQGLRMEGDSYHGRFVIADIRVDLPLPTERLAFFDPPWNPGNTVLMHREPQGIWRVDYQLPAGETPEQALAPASLKARIDAQLASVGFPGVPWELDWCSVYSARAMTLPDYVNGHVLYCGDAAHMLPIFGVRGANTGWQDSQNLAWKLAAVAQGVAGPALLASYTHERVGAAREICEEAGKSTRFMTPPTRGFRRLRDATLSLALTQEFVRPLLHWRTSRPHEYLDSPLNSPEDDDRLFAAGPRPGAPLANVRLGPDRHLLDLTPAGFWLLLFQGEASADADLVAAAQAWQARGVALTISTVGAQAQIVDTGPMAALYGARQAGTAYLVRPDQHVCARWVRVTPHRLDAALARALALKPAR